MYLNDHLAGATLGLELARRTARENEGNTLGTFLADALVPEIEEDRHTLQRLIDELGFAPSRPKLAAAWLAEKLGRLKLNGELTRYSPLSRLLELEALRLASKGSGRSGSPWTQRVTATESGASIFKRLRSGRSHNVRVLRSTGSLRLQRH